MATLTRTYSEKFFVGNASEVEHRNVAVEWLDSHRARLVALYVLFLSVAYGSLSGSGLSVKKASSLVNVAHGLITFFGLHWAKGSPDPTAQGEYDHLTVWEQIDGGRPWTATKQIFILVPTIMMLIALNAASYERDYMALNLPVYALCVVPKVPFMHRVRLFGINSTVGIDDVVDPTQRPGTKGAHRHAGAALQTSSKKHT